MIFASAPALVTLAVPAAMRGQALGVYQMSAAVGYAFGPLLGGVAVCLAVVAVTFRTIDLEVCGTIPMGTHFLWHSFLSCAGFVGLYTLTGLEAVKWGRRRGALPNPAE